MAGPLGSPPLKFVMVLLLLLDQWITSKAIGIIILSGNLKVSQSLINISTVAQRSSHSLRSETLLTLIMDNMEKIQVLDSQDFPILDQV